MDLTTILIIVLLFVLLGGGWYGRGRWYGRWRWYQAASSANRSAYEPRAVRGPLGL